MARAAGVKIGMQILQINETDTRTCTKAEAMAVVKASSFLRLVVVRDAPNFEERLQRSEDDKASKAGKKGDSPKKGGKAKKTSEKNTEARLRCGVVTCTADGCFRVVILKQGMCSDHVCSVPSCTCITH